MKIVCFLTIYLLRLCGTMFFLHIVQELVERCQTRLTKVEIQQQQTPSHEALDNITARQIFGKLINLLMSVLALLLVFVSTISGMLQPFTRSPVSFLYCLPSSWIFRVILWLLCFAFKFMHKIQCKAPPSPLSSSTYTRLVEWLHVGVQVDLIYYKISNEPKKAGPSIKRINLGSF